MKNNTIITLIIFAIGVVGFVIYYFSSSSSAMLVSVNSTTKAEILVSELDFGTIPLNREAKKMFVVKNTGVNPLIIYDIETSCGCTGVNWNRKPVKPGEETVVEVIYNDKYPGFFTKTVTLFANIETPLVCRIKGVVSE